MEIEDEVEALLRGCAAARAAGKDFPTVWNTFLKRHPLVVGPPVQRMANGEAWLEMRLTTGQRLLFGNAGYSLR